VNYFTPWNIIILMETTKVIYSHAQSKQKMRALIQSRAHIVFISI